MAKHVVARYAESSVLFSRETPGVYVFYLGELCVYVGSAGNVRLRLRYHELLGKFDRAVVTYCDLSEVSDLETKYITELNPALNVMRKGAARKPIKSHTLPVLLTKARERRGLSQRELAKMVGIDQADLWRIETGKRKPSFEAAEKIAQIFPDVHEMYLFYPERYQVAA